MPTAQRQIGSRRPDAETIALIDLVWGRLQARLERGMARVELLASNLFDRTLEPHEIVEAIEICEALSSRLFTLGLRASADLVRRVGQHFEQPNLESREAVALASLLDDARMALAGSVEEVKLLSHNGEPLAVIGEVSEPVDELIWVAASQGLPVTHHTGGVGVTNDDVVAAVVVVVQDPEIARARPLLRGIRETHPSQPILLLAPDTDAANRARVVDTVSLILSSDSMPLDVVAEVRREIVRARHPRSVTIYGQGADELVEPLWRRGLAAQVESSPSLLMTQLRSGESRAVVLMPETGELTPDELLGLIRTDRGTRATVVVMIGEQASGARAHAALREGADDFFGSDGDLDDLAVALKARLKRRAELEPVADATNYSGTVAWSTALVLIERMLLISFRNNTPVGVGLLQLPTTGLSEGLDDEIAAEFRGEDVTTRIDDGRLLIALQGANRRVLLRRLNDIQTKFNLREQGIRSVGLEFPIDGRSVDGLIDVGEAAIERSKEDGGPLVVGADWQPWRAAAADVMLVDPDPTLGAVMSATLARRGLRVVQHIDALDALEELSGRSKNPLPRVVLMELDQRGIDGLQFLRQLRDAGTTDRFQLIIVSSRTQESDLRRAFELGADDFVPKPFSAPLLMHRLARALDDN